MNDETLRRVAEEFEAILTERVRRGEPLLGPEPWFDRQRLAEHLACSVRSIELCMADGMPHHKVMGRVKFKVSEVEPWLAEHGHLERLGSPEPAS